MSGADPVAALEQLAIMRERGLVTAEEYDAKRADILARLSQPAPSTLAQEAARAVERPAAAAPAAAAKPAKKESSAAGGAVLLVLIIGGAWWFFGRGSGGGGGVVPDLQPWTAPAGYTKYDAKTAYVWVNPTASECLGDHCWAMELVTRDGCPTSLYVELSLEDATGTSVGYTNDVAGVLAAGQKARLVFDSFEASATKARLTQVTCY